MSNTERVKYKIAGPATWELIRAAYLAGASAPALAERYGVGEHAIRKRITKEKWSKRAYAEALEARGLAPPKAKPDFIEEGVVREAARQAAEAAAAAETNAWVEKVAAEEDPGDVAAALKRRALAQASVALVQGQSREAQALAALAEQMKKHAREAVAAPARGMVAEAEPTEAERADVFAELFSKAAYIAAIMVHDPSSAPSGFIKLVKQWRERNLGEGAEDADAVAHALAESNARFLRGDYLDMLPDDIRMHQQRRWAEMRAEMEARAGA